jgi:DNA-3-methyladenine glycosylase
VARDLVGAVVVSTLGGARIRARILETEAYLGRDDPASHAYRGRHHPGNAALYGPQGSWYVYRSYGIHWCANLVAGRAGLGAAVLLRGVAIVEGVDVARRRRAGAPLDRLGDGPGKLCQALAIDRRLDGVPMRDSPVLVSAGELGEGEVIEVTPRIGISRATDWPLRFVLSTRRP